MYKRIEFDAHSPHTGEATVQLAAFPNRRGGLSIEKRAFAESESPLYDVLKTIQPEVGITYLLVNALSAWEYYDDNKNGDGFNERPYRVGVRAQCGHPDCTKSLDGWIAEHELITKHYKSFEEHGGIYLHHCFPAGTPVVLGDGTRSPIEEVEVGTPVATHDGVHPVTAVFRTPYQGPGVKLRLRGQLDPLIATAEHQVLVLGREQVHCRHGYNRLSKSPHTRSCVECRQEVPPPQWRPLSEVLPGDYLLLRPPTYGDEDVPPALAALVGWVASEGYLGAKGIIQFTFASRNTDDLDSVRACFQSLGIRVTTTPRPQYGTTMLTACSKTLHAQLSLYVSGTLTEKHLTPAIRTWNREARLRLLGAYIDGDGHVARSGLNHGQLRIRSSSKSMLLALADLIRSFEVPATLNWDTEPGPMIAPTNGKTYQGNGSGCVAVKPDYVPPLVQYSRKTTTRKVDGVTQNTLFEGYHLVQVTERDDIQLDEEVFNLEVEGPHSFVASEVVVHNCNKDKKKSLGSVHTSLWNPKMHRNELLLRYVNERDPSIPTRVAANDFPAVSMGAHVRWDVCSICGHRAATRADYCEHAKNYLRKILADGRKVSVLNPSAKLFDISMVWRPADPTGWAMMKVASPYAVRGVVSSAELGEQWEQQARVVSTFNKVAEEISDAWAAPRSFMGNYAREARSSGVRPLPTQGDIYRFAAEKLALALNEPVLDRLVLATPALTALLGHYPEPIQKVASEIHNVMRQRAYEPSADFPNLSVGPGARYRAAEPPRTDLLTITDPYTGHVYQTTRGAAMDASTNDAKTRLLHTGLFGGLYAAGLHLGLRGGLGLWSVPAGLALGAATDRFLSKSPAPYRNPLYATDQGIPVSGGTEFKMASAASWASKLAADLHERTGGGEILPLLRRTSPAFQKWASLDTSDQVAYLLRGAVDDTQDPPALNLRTLADNFHTLVTSGLPFGEP